LIKDDTEIEEISKKVKKSEKKHLHEEEK